MTRRRRLAKALDATMDTPAGFTAVYFAAVVAIIAAVLTAAALISYAGIAGQVLVFGSAGLVGVWLVGRAVMLVRRHYLELTE